MRSNQMKLVVLTPHAVLLERSAQKIVAEAQNGSFVLKPRHVDFTTALVPGILAFTTASSEEFFVAVDEGILVKCGEEVLVACRAATTGADLGELEATVRERFQELDRRERNTRAALARLEADFVRRFVALREPLP